MNLTKWLRDNTEDSHSVAYIEVGYLGYFTNNRIIDLAGLVTPDITDNIAKGDFASGFWDHRPDYFVYVPDFDWAFEGITADARFGESYIPVAELPGPGDANLTIYEYSEIQDVGTDRAELD